jgi:hypothetical protein
VQAGKNRVNQSRGVSEMEFLDKLFGMFASEKQQLGRKRKNAVDEAQRSTVRKRQRMTDGFIWSEAMLKPRACTIKDMSALGAQVDIWNEEIKASLLQGSLKLYSSSDRQEVDCKMTWRKGNSAGLRFMSGFHAPTRKYS